MRQLREPSDSGSTKGRTEEPGESTDNCDGGDRERHESSQRVPRGCSCCGWDRDGGIDRRRNRAGAARVELAAQALEVDTEIGGTLVTKLTIPLHRLLNDQAKLGGNARVELSERNGILVQDLVKNGTRRVTLKRKNPRRHFVEHNPERKNIRARVQRFAQNLLGRHVRDGAQRAAWACQLSRVHFDGSHRGRSPSSTTADFCRHLCQTKI